ncbi:MAG: hypothetical protein V4606_04740 [Patescibacteria group bacterium]
MSDPAIPLLAAYTRALVHQKIPETEQQLALLFAKDFLQRVVDEHGRLSFGELKSASLNDLNRQLSTHSEMLMQMLTDPEQGFGFINSQGRPILIER